MTERPAKVAGKTERQGYYVGVRCGNCGERDGVTIPLGKPVADVLCPYCGCKTMTPGTADSLRERSERARVPGAQPPQTALPARGGQGISCASFDRRVTGEHAVYR